MKCQYEDCNEDATSKAVGRDYLGNPGHPDVADYCDTHCDIVAEEGAPEYLHICPNCGCMSGVN